MKTPPSSSLAPISGQVRSIEVQSFVTWTGATYVFLLGKPDVVFSTILPSNVIANGNGVASDDSTIVGYLTSRLVEDFHLQLYRNQSVIGQPIPLMSKGDSDEISHGI